MKFRLFPYILMISLALAGSWQSAVFAMRGGGHSSFGGSHSSFGGGRSWGFGGSHSAGGAGGSFSSPKGSSWGTKTSTSTPNTGWGSPGASHTPLSGTRSVGTSKSSATDRDLYTKAKMQGTAYKSKDEAVSAFYKQARGIEVTLLYGDGED